MVLKIMKVHKNAVVPHRATNGSAGMDLCACIEEPVIIPARGHAIIPTGIAISIPREFAAMVYARSGLAIKHGISLLNSVGVIDSDYRGEIKIGLINQFDEDYEIKPNERIAQLVIHPIDLPQIMKCDSLDDTQRGTGGFGSTGKI
ncbi:MAG: dUTP diphosphatase [Clostridia bacterium]|nr:dUTP diphosphatase [Clostridia bacterium]